MVSAADFFHLDEDLPLIEDALARRGVSSVIVDWHDSEFDWVTLDAAVVRSTWDYTSRLGDFLAWSASVSERTTLMNPIDVLRWNTDKRYLLDLERLGIKIAPTAIVEPGQVGDEFTSPAGAVTAMVERTGASELVVKPAVSAGGRDTERHPSDPIDQAVSHIESLLSGGRAAMVQPYLARIEKEDESGLVYIANEFSHAFKKGAMLSAPANFVEGHFREERITPHSPTRQELQASEDALNAIDGCAIGVKRADLLYARVDLVADGDGAPLLLELELTEPSLFCTVAPESAERFADAIVSLMKRSA